MAMPSWPKHEQPPVQEVGSSSKKKERRVVVSEEDIQRVREALVGKSESDVLRDYRELGMKQSKIQEALRQMHALEASGERPSASSDIAERVRQAVAPRLVLDEEDHQRQIVTDDARLSEQAVELASEDRDIRIPETIHSAFLEARTVADLNARLDHIGLSRSMRDELSEAFRLRQEAEAKEAREDPFKQFPPEMLHRLRVAAAKKGSREAVVDAHAQFGLTKAQIRSAFYAIDEEGLQLTPDDFAYGAFIRQVRAFMLANQKTSFGAVERETGLTQEYLKPIYAQLNQEGFLARTQEGRWLIQKEGSAIGSAYLAREKMPTDPELQEPARLLPEIKQVLAKTHNAYPDYLRWRFGLSDVQATYVLRTLRDDGFLREAEDGEMRIFPEDGSGKSYPVVFPEGASRARAVTVPHFPRPEPETDILQRAPFRSAKDLKVFGDERPLVRQRVKPTEPPTIDPLNPPEPVQPLPRRKRGERKILPEVTEPERVIPNYQYQEPEVTVGAVPPLPVERDKEGKRVLPKPPRPYQHHLDKAAEKYRLKPPPARVVEEAKRSWDFWAKPFDYEEDVTDDAEFLDDKGSSKAGSSGTTHEEVDDRESDAPPESGERVREPVDRAKAQKELKELQHILAFAPRGAEYADRRAELEARVEAMKQLVEQSELEEERKVLRHRMNRIGEELAEEAEALKEAEAAFQKAQAELLEKQKEATAAQTAYSALPGAMPLPKEYAARAKQLADWQKKAKAMPPGEARKALEELAAAFERVMSADRAVVKAKGLSREARQDRDEALARREALLQEFTAAEEKDKGLFERMKVLDGLIVAGLAAGGLAAVAWEGPQEESKEVREAREEAAKEEKQREKQQADKRKANEEAAAKTAERWRKAGVVGRYGTIGGASALGIVGGAFWLAGKATQLLFYVLRHPVKSFQFMWNKMVKLVQEGGDGKAKPPTKGGSPSAA